MCDRWRCLGRFTVRLFPDFLRLYSGTSHISNLALLTPASRLKGITLNELAAHARQNTIDLFGLSELEDPPAETTAAVVQANAAASSA